MNPPLSASPAPTYWVLLIGVNSYRPNASGYGPSDLYGPVNDVDHLAEQLARMGIPRSAMTKIIAPGSKDRQRRNDEVDATRERIVWHLEHTAIMAAPGDRVIVYFAGHGTQLNERVDSQLRTCGAIVPADCKPIFDHELGGFCDRIYEKTQNLTVFLDCCYAADVARSDDGDGRVRGCMWPSPPASPVEGEQLAQGEASKTVGVLRRGRMPGYTAAAACRPDQKALESYIDGVWLGRFTRALCEALAPHDERVLEQTWHRFWPQVIAQLDLRKEVKPGRRPPTHGPQDPELLGPSYNLLLGGPPGPPPDSAPYRKQQDGSYLVEAGWLAGMEEGTRLEVAPAEESTTPGAASAGAGFAQPVPPLVVVESTPWSCRARQSNEDAASLPQTGRARVAQARPLVVGLAAEVPDWVHGVLVEPATADGLDLRRNASRSDDEIEAYLGVTGSMLWLGDRLYGPQAQDSSRPLNALWEETIPVENLPNGFVDRLRAVLRHYTRYVRLLRIFGLVQRDEVGVHSTNGLDLIWKQNDACLELRNNHHFLQLSVRVYLMSHDGRVINIIIATTHQSIIAAGKSLTFERPVLARHLGAGATVERIFAVGRRDAFPPEDPFIEEARFVDVVTRGGQPIKLESRSSDPLAGWYFSYLPIEVGSIDQRHHITTFDKRRALLVAVEEPGKGENPAWFSRNDIHQLRQALRSQGFPDVRTLEDAGERRVTKQVLLDWIEENIPRPGENTLLWFHYSGHGEDPKTDGKTWLRVQGKRPNDPSERVELGELLTKLEKHNGQVLVTLDACHAGTPQTHAGIDVFSATSPREKTSGSPYREMGVFSYHLILAILGTTRMTKLLTRNSLIEALQREGGSGSSGAKSEFSLPAVHVWDYQIIAPQQVGGLTPKAELDLSALDADSLKDLVDQILEKIKIAPSSNTPEAITIRNIYKDLRQYSDSAERQFIPRTRVIHWIKQLAQLGKEFNLQQRINSLKLNYQ